MTSNDTKRPGHFRAGSGRSAAREKPSAGQLFFCFMATFCLFLILRNADAAVEYMGRGLTLCTRTVIPSLFPFMVISELLVRSGAGEALGRLLARPMRWLFGLSGAGSTAVFLGSLCGFPMGAKTAVGLLDSNLISREECEHLLTFSNNPSSAFLITAVGVSLFGNRRIGTLLYLIVLGSGLLVGFLARFLLRPGNRTVHPHFPSGLHPGGVEMFTSSMSGATSGMLTVCAYVVFFSTLSGTLSCLSEAVGGLPPLLYAAGCGLLEVSGGISGASALPGSSTALGVSAAIAGWSGLSVHCQVMSMCAGRGLSFKPYIAAKAAQSVICGTVMVLLLRVAPPELWSPAADTALSALLDLEGRHAATRIVVPPAVGCVGFAAAWLVLLGRRISERHI